jgi:starvation-inducible outer membrane lipoprotein
MKNEQNNKYYIWNVLSQVVYKPVIIFYYTGRFFTYNYAIEFLVK